MADYTKQYNTPLTPEEQLAYTQWARSMGRDPIKELYDYDLQGAFKDGAARSENNHLPDTYKKPNHPTFSDESIHHGENGLHGGHWSKDGVDDVFTPGPTNIKEWGLERLRQYMQQNEPDVKLNTVDMLLNELM